MGWCLDGIGRGGGMWGGARFMHPFWGLFFFGLVALIVVLGVLWLVRRSRQTTGGTGVSTMATPLQIAQRRLASGEITVDEFERIRERISTQSGG